MKKFTTAKQVSAMAIAAMLSLSNFECRTMKVKRREILNSGGKKYSSLYAFGEKVATFFPDLSSILITTGKIVNVAAVGAIASVLNNIPGVFISRQENVLYLNGEVWDGTGRVFNLSPSNELKAVS